MLRNSFHSAGRIFTVIFALLAFMHIACAERLPNVILIVADDLGYADGGDGSLGSGLQIR
jgi:hypothetical protein